MQRGALPRHIIVSLGLVILGWLSLAAGQSRPSGLWTGQNTGCKYFSNHTPSEHVPQNWCVLQTRRGTICVANQGGLLEYDGVSWSEIDIPNQTARSLALAEDGTIYVGGTNEVGFLKEGPDGRWQYVSLLDYIPESKRSFSTVWRVNAAREGVYFRTKKYLFRWNRVSRQMKVWEPQGSFDASFTCGGKLFVHQRNIGLKQMVGDSLQMIPGDETFGAVKIYMMVPYDHHRLLIGTLTKGLFIYDVNRQKVSPFPTAADDYLHEKELRHGIRLSSSPGDFALATRWGGLVIIDSHGNIKYMFDTTSGLQNDSVMYVFEDFQGNLWLALERGVTKVEYASPISIFDHRAHLHGLVLSVVTHHDDLIAGTSRGLYALSPSGKGQFQPIPGLKAMCLSVVSLDGSLLTATENGVFQISHVNNNYTSHMVIDNRSYILLPSRRDPNRIWVGTHEGLVSLYRTGKGGRFRREREFKETHFQIRTMVEDPTGNLWLGTRASGSLRIDFPVEGKVAGPAVTHYGVSQGLPPGEVRVFAAAGQVIFAAGKRVFRFDEERGVFLPDYTLGKEFADGSRNVFRLVEDEKRNIWFHSELRNFLALPRPGGTFSVHSKPFSRVPGVNVNAIYPDPSGDAVWFASNDGLIRFDCRSQKSYDYDFPTLIRRVLVNGNPESGSQRPVVVDYRDRNLHFEFAAPCFQDASTTTYRCFLEGYDGDWSAWTAETRRGYTNLDAGMYTFRVQARDVYGNLGGQATFQFKVLPPWYQVWWAFLLYGLSAVVLMFLVVRWRSWRLKREKQALEHTVKERTSEIQDKNRQLEEQSEKLKEMDQVKSRFFANISHEFRTPLTLIMGPLEQMLYQCREKKQKKRLGLMLRNSQRLLGLISQLLELSRFASGKIKLQVASQNIVPFLGGIAASFDFAATQRELDLTFAAKEEDITLYFDPEKIEEAVCNLLINALKFTPAGGQITVHVSRNPGQEADFPAGWLEISIKDTGPGIPPDQLAHIFDRFYQSESTYEHHRKGSGIGLSIARELVELHHGRIDVHSREGEDSGTEFVIRLPLGAAHLESEEMVDLAEAAPRTKPPGEIPGLYSAELEGDGVDEADSQEGAEDREDIEGGTGEKDIILVVEDSADVREYIRGALESIYTVVEAEDGREGLERAREIIPDLIICDIMMPGIDGYEVCRTLKGDVSTSHIPVVLLTARAGEDDIVAGLETGADDYITKPFNTRILEVRLKNLIDLRRQLQDRLRRQMTLQPTEILVSRIDQEFIQELQEVIEKNLGELEFNVDQLCRKLYMSQATLYRKIKALCGESPSEFIRSYRLKRAADLLKSRFGTIAEIAFEVGFSSTAYFTKCFKDKFHQLPSTFLAAESQSS
jgi:signal transduction histidine kinase/DNA-binding response OmpR family regulator